MNLNNRFHLGIILFFILLFSLVIRLYRISEPKKYYFDEVYHIVTARAYAQNNKAAYNPFSPPPEANTAFDWLHPPLAKMFQAASIKIVGDNSFGWRLPGAIFGTGVVAGVFVLGLILFNPAVAVFSSLVIAFENLTFVMSRITMNDIFVTFFALFSFVFAALYAKRDKNVFLILCSIFLGFAVSSKWTGLYAIAGVLIFLTIWAISKPKKIFNPYYVFLVLIPPIIYLLSYSQYWLQGYTIRDFINLHKQIWWYQKRGDLKHSYATTPLLCAPEGLSGPKEFCPWALDVRPVYLSYEPYGTDKAGYIYNLGNPLIFWVGVGAISYIIGRFIEKRERKLLLLLIGYFIFWLPWVFTPRILFFHHYLPSVPFMSVALGVGLATIFKTKYWILSLAAIFIFALAFFYFYPISSGLPIPIDEIKRFMLLRTWR